jgi:holo-[acyl-carrier protein] synthase
MIIGVGTDICDIRRIEQSIDGHGERFLNKIFTSKEQVFCDKKPRPAMSYAKRFAAKEAVAKALSGTDTGSLSWKSVEVTNDPSGRPRVLLTADAEDRAEKLCPENHKLTISLSLSDDYPYATAFAIAEAIPVVTQTP